VNLRKNLGPIVGCQPAPGGATHTFLVRRVTGRDARSRRRARADRDTATAVARRYRGRCCATAMATMTGFG